jgi:hypothetical protein
MIKGCMASIVLLTASCASTSPPRVPEQTVRARPATAETAVPASSPGERPSLGVRGPCAIGDVSDVDDASASASESSWSAPYDAARDLPLEEAPSLLEELVTTSDAPPRAATEISESERMPDRFMVRGGFFYFSKLRTKASFDLVSAPIGATIDFNRTLGLDSSDFSGRFDARYRFNDYHAIGASWYRFRLSGSRTISKSVDWDGMTYPINAQVDSAFNQDIYELNYRFSFYHNADIEFGALAGFNVQHFDIRLNSTNTNQSSGETLTAPLPVFGAFVNYYFTPRLMLHGQYEFFFLDFDKASGQLQDFITGLEFRVFKNMAVGGAFDFYTMNANYETSTTLLDIEQTWRAFMMYATIYF